MGSGGDYNALFEAARSSTEDDFDYDFLAYSCWSQESPS